MFAIAQVGCGQYRVVVGDKINVDRINKKEGDKISLKNILLLSKNKEIQVGQPYLKNAEITCLVLRHFKAPKKIAYKYRRRKSSHTKKGHRQNLTSLLIEKINIE